jgi:hypothetical protein
MHAHSAGTSSYVWNHHHHHEIMLSISPAEAHKPYSGGNPYMQHSPLLLRSVEQETKQKDKATVHALQ